MMNSSKFQLALCLFVAALILVVLLPDHSTGIACLHSENGTCDGGGLFGFCSSDGAAGEYGCDGDGFCKKKKNQLMKNGKGGGCFKNKKCCCNEPDYCNTVLVNRTEFNGQMCQYSTVSSEGETTMYPCKDKWCFAFKYSASNGQRGNLRGCQNRLHLRFATKGDVKLTQLWQAVAGKPCDEILAENEAAEQEQDGARIKREATTNDNGETCAQITATLSDGTTAKATHCCCRGKDMCNSQKSMKLTSGKGLNLNFMASSARPGQLIQSQSFFAAAVLSVTDLFLFLLTIGWMRK